MKKIKLIKGLSYTFTVPNGETVKVTNKAVASVSDEAYEYAMSTGYFECVPVKETHESPEQAKAENKELEACTKQELAAIADNKGIDISSCKTKAEMIDAIKASSDSEDSSDSTEAAEADFGE